MPIKLNISDEIIEEKSFLDIGIITNEHPNNSVIVDYSSNIYANRTVSQHQNTATNSKQSSNELVNVNVKTGKELVTINGWNIKNQTYFKYCLHRLKYYRIINNFFFFDLKKREGNLSWIIIVLSAISSVLSLMNTNSGQDIFLYSSKIVEWILVLVTLIVTLISSYIKKQQFIDRINNIDRYLQQLNQTVEELNITFILEPEKRESYDEFCKKYIPIIKNLSVYPATFSPTEWKKTVYIITKYYPELILGDGTDDELLWPWFYMNNKETVTSIPEGKKRFESKFGNTVITSTDFLKSRKFGYSFINSFKNTNYNISVPSSQSESKV
jgi:hypothetical protein